MVPYSHDSEALIVSQLPRVGHQENSGCNELGQGACNPDSAHVELLLIVRGRSISSIGMW